MNEPITRADFVIGEVNHDQEIASLKQDLYHEDSYSTFEVLLHDEGLIDIMAAHLSAAKGPLMASTRKVADMLAPCAAENSWKRDLDKDDSVEKVLNTATNTILKLELRGAALKLGIV